MYPQYILINKHKVFGFKVKVALIVSHVTSQTKETSFCSGQRTAGVTISLIHYFTWLLKPFCEIGNILFNRKKIESESCHSVWHSVMWPVGSREMFMSRFYNS